MDIREFSHAVSLGLGRAVLHVHEYLPSPYVDIILDACLHVKAHDPQIEGRRAEYMLDIVRRTGDPSFYKNGCVAESVGEMALDGGGAQGAASPS